MPDDTGPIPQPLAMAVAPLVDLLLNRRKHPPTLVEAMGLVAAIKGYGMAGVLRGAVRCWIAASPAARETVKRWTAE